MKIETKFDMWWENQGGYLEHMTPKDAARYAWAGALRWAGATIGSALDEVTDAQVECDNRNQNKGE